MQISVRKMNLKIIENDPAFFGEKKWHGIYLCHEKLIIYNNSYIPVKKAIAAIIPRNNKIIPIATKVSCSSTELTFFIIFKFLMLTIKFPWRGKIGKKS